MAIAVSRPRSANIPMWIVDGLPFIAVLTALWMKLVYVSLLLPGEWWSGGENYQWLGEAVYVLHALMLNPGVGFLTLAALLAILTPLALLSRGWRLLGLL